MIARRKDDPF